MSQIISWPGTVTSCHHRDVAKQPAATQGSYCACKQCWFYHSDRIKQTRYNMLIGELQRSSQVYLLSANLQQKLSHDTIHTEQVKTTDFIYRDPTYLQENPIKGKHQGDGGEENSPLTGRNLVP